MDRDGVRKISVQTLFYFVVGTLVLTCLYRYMCTDMKLSTDKQLANNLILTIRPPVVNLERNMTIIEVKMREPNTLLDLPTNFNISNTNSHHSTVKHTILWYNPPEWIERRQRGAFMETCEYNNCVYTKDRSHLHSSSAIVFVPSVGGFPRTPPISPEERNHNQVWVVYSLEPPMNFYINNYKSPQWTNTINWTMTYRFDSDILATYGTMQSRKIPRVRDYNKIFQKKKKMVAWIVSHCHAVSNRDEYVAELKKAGVEVDIFGSCGKNIRHLDNIQVEDLLNTYKFYLSFENSLCKDYITEKVFKKYDLDLILIVRGGGDYDKLLPTKTFINTAHFPNMSSLANYVRQLADDKNEYIQALRKKDKYEVLDEDHFGYPYAVCELCRKLNNVEKHRNSYSKMTDFLEDKTCRMAKDIPNFAPNPIQSNIYG